MSYMSFNCEQEVITLHFLYHIFAHEWGMDYCLFYSLLRLSRA